MIVRWGDRAARRAGRAGNVASPYLLGALCGWLCAVGVLNLGPAATGCMLLFALVVGAILSFLASDLPRLATLPEVTVTRAAAGCFACVMALDGLQFIGWLAVVALVLGAVLAAAPVARSVRLLRHGAPPPAEPQPRLPGREVADLLAQLATDVLLEEWHATGRAITRHPGLLDETALVALRALLLDELERRDAGGFSAWQAAASRGPCSPAAFLGQQQPPA